MTGTQRSAITTSMVCMALCPPYMKGSQELGAVLSFIKTILINVIKIDGAQNGLSSSSERQQSKELVDNKKITFYTFQQKLTDRISRIFHPFNEHQQNHVQEEEAQENNLGNELCENI